MCIRDSLYKPTLREMLTPTVRTLHQLENNMLDCEDRNGEGTFWVLLYVVSAMFVHLFGKYITRWEKYVVSLIIKETFVVRVVEVATSLKLKDLEENQLD